MLFSRKISSGDHPKLTFNGKQNQQYSSQTHVGLFLHNAVDFIKLIDKKIDKYNKKIGLMIKLSLSV